jgi:hypothetical protein
MAKNFKPLTALAPLALPDGREIRSGDAFEASAETAAPLIEAGLARDDSPPAVEPKGKK